MPTSSADRRPSVLVANRGEIAVRVMRAARELGMRVVGVRASDEPESLHVSLADEVRRLDGSGPRAYLDVDAIVQHAVDADCQLVHPGYGFLSESAELARACEARGLTFVGARPDTLDLFGDKVRGRALAEQCDVPVLRGTSAPTSVEQARALLASLGPGAGVLVKASAGGGGRGIRVVRREEDLEEAMERCRSEAARSFGDGSVFVEQLLSPARHVEVQVIGDGTGDVLELGERECSLQRRHQKLVEFAPAPGLSPALRERLLQAAGRMARTVRLRGLTTFEFLVAADDVTDEPAFAFIEANPRLQVEHTVTEQVLGVDLVQAQLRVALGASLGELGLRASSSAPRGMAVQLRLNAESVADDGSVRPASGTLSRFTPPTGPGVRIDTAAFPGMRVDPRFDSLLAKIVVHVPAGGVADLLHRAYQALRELDVHGVPTNRALLQDLLVHPDVLAGRLSTELVERLQHSDEPRTPARHDDVRPVGDPAAGASADPLSVLHHGKAEQQQARGRRHEQPADGEAAVGAPMHGTVVAVSVAEGETVAAGAVLAVLEAMKMEHVATAPTAGVVRRVSVAVGDTVDEGDPLVVLLPADGAADLEDGAEQVDLDSVRPDLEEVLLRHHKVLDEARPDAVARRRRTGQRTARENVQAVSDDGSFVEYGPLAIAAQRLRRSVEDLVDRTPADGLVAGVATVNSDLFGPERSRAVVVAYDYTVLAGTQGHLNHRKKDRMFELAERWRLPVVLFAEGGGGRPGDTDGLGVAQLDSLAFSLFGRLSGTVPLVGVVSGYCFAGNAALLGCCDVIIATEGSNIGMGGPAMIEGGGLGVFRPDEVGPVEVQRANGVVDVVVPDEAAAAAVARRYLSYFQGPVEPGDFADQRLLRHVVPENRLRAYDVRTVVETLVDAGSLLELRRDFGKGVVTALARIEGRPLGVLANVPTHLGGAIDREAADKAARFLQLCDAFGLPVLSLCDTPGFMVGPAAEETATVRHFSRLFVTGANLRVPVFCVILRKAYGLGAQAMAGGNLKAPFFTVAWPTGELGSMGLEGSVKLGYRKELEAITDPAERKAAYDRMVAETYERGRALNVATHFEFDDVIDPSETRSWIARGLRSTAEQVSPPPGPRSFVDTW